MCATAVSRDQAAQTSHAPETAAKEDAVSTDSVSAILDSQVPTAPKDPVLITATTVANVLTVNVYVTAALLEQTALS